MGFDFNKAESSGSEDSDEEIFTETHFGGPNRRVDVDPGESLEE